MLALDHHAFDGERPAEDLRRLVHLSGPHRLARGAGRHLGPVLADPGRDRDREAVLFTQALQAFGVARPAMAEADVETGGHMAHAEPVLQHVAGEGHVAQG